MSNFCYGKKLLAL